MSNQPAFTFVHSDGSDCDPETCKNVKASHFMKGSLEAKVAQSGVKVRMWVKRDETLSNVS
jgi:hypothetical protein